MTTRRRSGRPGTAEHLQPGARLPDAGAPVQGRGPARPADRLEFVVGPTALPNVAQWRGRPPPVDGDPTTSGCPTRCNRRRAGGCRSTSTARSPTPRCRHPSATAPSAAQVRRLQISTSTAPRPVTFDQPGKPLTVALPVQGDAVGAHHRGRHQRRLLRSSVRHHRPGGHPIRCIGVSRIRWKFATRWWCPRRRPAHRWHSGISARSCWAVTAAPTHPTACTVRHRWRWPRGAGDAGRTLTVPAAIAVRPTVWVRAARAPTRRPHRPGGHGGALARGRRPIDVEGRPMRPPTAIPAPRGPLSRTLSPTAAPTLTVTLPPRGDRVQITAGLSALPPPQDGGRRPRRRSPGPPASNREPRPSPASAGHRHPADQPADWDDVIDRTALGFDQLKPPGTCRVSARPADGKPIAPADAARNRTRQSRSAAAGDRSSRCRAGSFRPRSPRPSAPCSKSPFRPAV